MPDPRPGLLDISGSGQPAATAWQQAVQDKLAWLARSAARPAREAVPAGAEAVLFADMAELLACLARDWLEGSLLSNWWWQSLPRELGVKQQVVQAWVDAPAYIPAALEELVGRRAEVVFARRLDSHDALRILSAALGHAGLADLSSSIHAWVFAEAVKDRTFAPPPWQRVAPESGSVELELSQAALLGIGLGLRRAPRYIRSMEFSSTLIHWLGIGPEPESNKVRTPLAQPEQASDDLLTTDATAPVRPSKGQSLPPQKTVTPDDHSQEKIQPELQGPVMPAQDTISTGDSSQQSSYDPVELALPDDVLSPSPLGLQQSAVEETQPPVADPSAPAAIPQEWPAPIDGQWFETALGGLFYLINLGLFCGLYGDFTTPLRPGLDLPIWDFLTLLGRALLAEDSLPDDPIWKWLARLAGRDPGTLPGAGYQPPDAWRMPVDWLAVFAPNAQWTWSLTEDRLRVHHPDGFCVIDVPLVVETVEDQLVLELESYTGFFASTVLDTSLMPSAPNEIPSGRLADWLGWLIPYLHKRLCLALGLETVEELPRALCIHPARVYLTETHLDVTFSLKNLPLAVRLAGLDRDPGWVPAANRYVKFNYE